MSSKDLNMPIAIKANQLGKCFALYRQPSDRLKQLLWGRFKKYTNDFWALQNICFEIHAGEIVGIVGRNGAGKSTLLQLLCGTLKPSTGKLQVTGRVAALLELGAGFNPDFTGRENVYMNAAILGLQRHEIDDRIQSIIEFAEIGQFIDQPVRTYSSGMFMRLAFSVATSSDPDILIIDEALSVGDGAFARKSFERIMSLKERGKTILFCSHAMYQVEALCSRALWLENGSIKMDDSSAKVTSAYQASLIESSPLQSEDVLATRLVAKDKKTILSAAQFTSIHAYTENSSGKHLQAISKKSTLTIELSFIADTQLPNPVLALGINDASGRTIASATSKNDGFAFTIKPDGSGLVRISFPNIALLKGKYFITLFLICEHAIHIYDQATNYVSLEVSQDGLEQGVVSLEHVWQA
ncbi:MAG: ABC transporter ATP-binding protein [Polynucleobacter sp.]